jgi:hypothetical protein
MRKLYFKVYVEYFSDDFNQQVRSILTFDHLQEAQEFVDDILSMWVIERHHTQPGRRWLKSHMNFDGYLIDVPKFIHKYKNGATELIEVTPHAEAHQHS